MATAGDDVTRRAAAGDAVALTRALVAVPSVNPGLDPSGAGEEEVGRLAAGWLEDWGFEVEVKELEESRINVTATHGTGGRRLLLNGHLDTVGVEGMALDPFHPEVRDGRVWGRGSCDMKAGIGALLAASRRLVEAGHEGELVVALTADEEHESIGMEALVARGVTADAAVVCEPTGLAVMPAHRGFAWIELDFRGRAAHGSRPDLGVDAIRHAGRFLAELDAYETRLEEVPPHPLLDPPSVHAGTIEGGTVPPVYPDRCRLVVERRTLPGEASPEVVEEFRAVIRRLSERVADLDVEVRLGLHREGTEVPADTELVRRLLEACRREGVEEGLDGMSAWVDAGLLNEAGTPAVCFGPGSIEQAHTAEEWVRVDEIEAAARILEAFAGEFLAGPVRADEGAGGPPTSP